MSRPRTSDAPVTLLPFLAVLICTMGALIVLLVVVVQNARVGTPTATVAQTQGLAEELLAPYVANPTPDDLPLAPSSDTPIIQPPALVEAPTLPELSADAEAPARNSITLPTLLEEAPVQEEAPITSVADEPVGPTEEEVAEAQLEREKYLWEAEMLAEAMDKTRQRLAEKNLELAHLEEHTQRVVAELKQLQESANQASTELKSNVREISPAELTAIEEQIAAKQAELEQARATAAANQAPTYHLIPYLGTRGTSARPIYIECLPDAAVIRPENIRFEKADFAVPTDAKNPLAVTLRAIREHWVKTGRAANEEPYPLLIVRPGGEITYSACRAAMKAWDDRFGYELVDSSVKLTFPERDETLVAAIDGPYKAAKGRQRRLLKSIEIERGGSGPIFHASRGGGFENQIGERFARSNRPGNRPNDGRDTTIPTKQNPPGNPSSLGSSLTGSSLTGRSQSPSGASQQRDSSIFLAATRPGSLEGAAQDSSQSQGSPLGSAQSHDKAGHRGESSGSASDWVLPESDANTFGVTETDTNYVDSKRQANRPSHSDGSTSNRGPSNGATSNGASQSGQQGSSGDSGSSGESIFSLAESRGRDWALPNAVPNAIPIERPLFVVMNRAQLVLEAEPGTRQIPKVITFQKGKLAAAEALVATIRSRIKDWGVAGPGVYWRPKLEFEVSPDGQAAFVDLQSLLENSGLQLIHTK